MVIRLAEYVPATVSHNLLSSISSSYLEPTDLSTKNFNTEKLISGVPPARAAMETVSSLATSGLQPADLSRSSKPCSRPFLISNIMGLEAPPPAPAATEAEEFKLE